MDALWVDNLQEDQWEHGCSVGRQFTGGPGRSMDALWVNNSQEEQGEHGCSVGRQFTGGPGGAWMLFG